MESVYREKLGTPCSSGKVSLGRARLTLRKDLSDSCLDGLQEFGHIWLIYIFHKIEAPAGSIDYKGMFASRCCNRFNPIGMSLAKIDKIDGKTLHLSGIDIIHGTPIVDIKPYHYNDAIDMEKTKGSSDSVTQSSESDVTEFTTKFIEEANEELKHICQSNQLDFYSSESDIRELAD